MRTTVTLDPDVAAKLKETARESGLSFKEVLNSTVRRGFERGEAKPQPYRVRAQNLGVRPGVNLDKALQLAGELEDAETLRKLHLRK
ncbi:MAG: CopG family transcriptional regulator [Solirubrobacterales bacterium]